MAVMIVLRGAVIMIVFELLEEFQEIILLFLIVNACWYVCIFVLRKSENYHEKGF